MQPPPTHWSDALSRRVFLRSATSVLALPWLASLPLRSAQGKRLANTPSKPPRRFGCVYFSNGVEPEHWWTKPAADGLHFGPGLEPLSPYRNDLCVLEGLFNAQSVANPSAHLGRMPNLLSGAWVSLDQNDLRVGRTMDQVMAQRLREQTALPSLVLGIEPTELRLEDGLSMLYGSCISWSSPTRPTTKEIYPARAFDAIVGNRQQAGLDRTILDQVLADANSLRPQLAVRDRVKLDEYLESIRDIERRISRAAHEERLEGWQPTLAEADIPRPADELPQNVPDHMRLILDLIVLAFRMDRTRIVTCMLNNDLSQMNFGFLEGVQGSLHLDLTHNGRDPAREAMYLKTNQFHVAQFAYLLKRLREIEEGDQTLLDSSLLLLCSNLFDGDKHQADRMPMVLAGRGGGSLTPGRLLDYRERPPEERRACSLYLSLMDRMGVTLPQFGDSDRRLADL
ncbi:MAG: DUF1552 domain-containing protein [Planctomycetota bacterium]|nr:DUF1552 domain-containing protein [Planctomycetota bacterium]